MFLGFLGLLGAEVVLFKNSTACSRKRTRALENPRLFSHEVLISFVKVLKAKPYPLTVKPCAVFLLTTIFY